MSLLMDALKRAEKARQEQAARQQDTGAPVDSPSETREFDLTSIEREVATGAERDSRRERLATTTESTPPEPGVEMSLHGDGRMRHPAEDTAEGVPALEIIEQPEVEDRGLELHRFQSRSGKEDTDERPTFSLLDDEPKPSRRLDADEKTLRVESTTSMPSVTSIEDSMDQYFDGTQSMSVPMREVRSAVRGVAGEMPPPPEQTGSHTSTTQRRARTVMEAKTAAARARRGASSWVLPLLLLLLVVLAAAGGGTYFYLNVIAPGPSLIATGQPPPRMLPAPEPAPPAPTAQAAPVTPVLAVQTEVAPLVAAALPEVAARGELAPGASAEVEQPEPSVAMPPAPTVDEVLTQPETPVAQMPMDADAVAARLARAIESAGLRRQGSLLGSGIQVSRSQRRDPVSPLLQQGFDALKSGNSVAAHSAYERVLARDPNSRDALLGLAAVSVRAGDYNRAADLYARVLRNAPRDPVAQSALLGLHSSLDAVQAEAGISTLLQSDPDATYLHFALGNAYAAQGRWALAQESYFKAYSRDNQNPDYVFNLAVSLDQLGQRKAALEHYRRALQLADSRVAGFEPSSVLRRIQAMAAGTAGQ